MLERNWSEVAGKDREEMGEWPICNVFTCETEDQI